MFSRLQLRMRVVQRRMIISTSLTDRAFTSSFNDSSGVTGRPRKARALRIILIRHGESEGNINEEAYVDTPDWQIALTEKGKAQSREAGKRLKEILGPDESVFFYVSPYKRTIQTLEEIQKMLNPKSIWGVRHEPRIAEQQFGNFQNVEAVQQAKVERKRFGRFFYRFPNGEAGLDVYNRVTSFTSTLFRDSQQLRGQGVNPERMNIVIITHGLSIRLFLMRWFQFTVDDFEKSYNPSNASLNIMERMENKHGNQWFEILPETKKRLNLTFPSVQNKYKIADDDGS